MNTLKQVLPNTEVNKGLEESSEKDMCRMSTSFTVQLVQYRRRLLTGKHKLKRKYINMHGDALQYT